MANAPVFVSVPKLGLVSIIPSTGTAAVTLLTAGASGTKVVGLNVQSSDSAAKVAVVSVLRAGVAFKLFAVSVPAASGNDGLTPAVNLLTPGLAPSLPVDGDGQTYLFLQSGDALQVALTAAATTSTQFNFAAVAADF